MATAQRSFANATVTVSGENATTDRDSLWPDGPWWEGLSPDESRAFRLLHLSPEQRRWRELSEEGCTPFECFTGRRAIPIR